MARTVIVGDLHACTGELEELLEQLGFARAPIGSCRWATSWCAAPILTARWRW